MSVLDMFASALGGFLLCAVILMPSYDTSIPKKAADSNAKVRVLEAEVAGKQEEVANVERDVGRLKEQVERQRDIEAKGRKCQQGLERCVTAVARTFVVLQVQWEQNVGVDLHVTGPDSVEYYWENSNRARHSAGDMSAAWLSFEFRGRAKRRRAGLD